MGQVKGAFKTFITQMFVQNYQKKKEDRPLFWERATEFVVFDQ